MKLAEAFIQLAQAKTLLAQEQQHAADLQRREESAAVKQADLETVGL